MKFISGMWKKLLTAALAGGISVIIAACYGPPSTYKLLGPWTIRVKSNNSAPIPGLRVTILEYVVGQMPPDTQEILYTDTSGMISTRLETNHSDADHHNAALIQDVDSTDNGGTFRDTLVAKGELDTTTVVLNPK